jgi:phospholipid/cholesterol/gamma-HCH transport system substrate-binding protein
MKRPSYLSWEQLRVGALITVALTVLVIAVVRLGAASNLFAARYTLVTFVNNANGLRVGGSVFVAGKLAGTVREIAFLPVDADTTRNLRLVLDVDRSLQEQVRADSRARIKTVGLLGDRIIDISAGTVSYQALASGDTVLVLPGTDYEAVIEQASGAVGDLVQLTADLRTLTGGLVRGEGTAGQLLTNRDLYDDLTQTLERTNAVVARLQNPRGTMGRLLEDPTLYNNISTLAGSVDSLVTRLNSNEGTLGRLMRDDTLYTRMVGVMSGTDSLLRLARTGNGMVPRLLTDQELYDRMNKTLTDLNAILEDVRSNPQRYTKGLIRIF